MARKRLTPEQIVAILREADVAHDRNAKVSGSIPLTSSNVFKELAQRALPPKTPILQFYYSSVPANGLIGLGTSLIAAWFKLLDMIHS